MIFMKVKRITGSLSTSMVCRGQALSPSKLAKLRTENIENSLALY